MSEKQHDAEDWLGHEIQHSVENSFAVCRDDLESCHPDEQPRQHIGTGGSQSNSVQIFLCTPQTLDSTVILRSRLDTSLLNTSICKLKISFDFGSDLRKTLEIGALSTRTCMFFDVTDIRNATKYAVATTKSAVAGRQNFQSFTLPEIAKVATLFSYGN
ncbi:hypothetical protein AC578_1105 [Pseudocercospora eumusae]|uniref:Uncharacterized protein n=1 Tax=Pseudocercospora eumusae TaxID=321146 RepID=A0A139HTN4_9PEZI|nr:hypothetical protein AC578_1105 [Pseudocercospora eumusae]